MQVNIHRGSHEIGGSCIELESAGTRILLDIGLPLSGVDRTQPALLPESLDLQKRIDAVIISHPHQDHYGLLGQLDASIPVYSGPVTERLIRFNGIYMNEKPIRNHFIFFEAPRTFQVGSIQISPFLVDHSAVDSYAFLIESDGGIVIYSGDLRFHGRKGAGTRKVLERLPKECDLLLLEGTTISRPSKGVKTETEVEQEILTACNFVSGHCFASFSAQNVDRLVSFYKAARKSGRTMVVDLHTAMVLDRIGEVYPGIPNFRMDSFPSLKIYYSWRTSRRLEQIYGKRETLYKYKLFHLSREELLQSGPVLMMIRPSMKSDLSSLLKGRSDFLRDSLHIYSMWSGYLESDSTAEMIRFLSGQGVPTKEIHTSGHADAENLAKMIEVLAPRMVVPVHTDGPEIFSELSPSVRVVGDGEVLALDQ